MASSEDVAPLRSSRSQVEQPKPPGCYSRYIKRNLILILTIIAVILGIGGGLFLRKFDLDPMTKRYLGLPGKILMDLFKAIVIPLIVVSVVGGISSMDPAHMGKINLFAVTYYFGTTLVAVLIGIALVTIAHPGHPDLKAHSQSGAFEVFANDGTSFGDVIYDLFLNLFPDNLMTSPFESRRTRYIPVAARPENISDTAVTPRSEMVALVRDLKSAVQSNASHEVLLSLESQIQSIVNTTTSIPPKIATIVTMKSSNILRLLVFSFALGIVLAYAGEKGLIVREFLKSLDHLITRIVIIVIWYSPIGVFSLLVEQMLNIQSDGVSDLFQMLGWYMACYLAALLLHLFLFLMPLYWVATRRNPFFVLKGITEMIVVAFGTSSSAAALPTHMKCLEENVGVSRSIVQMILPVATTINMNGTACMEVIWTVFIAQLNGRDLAPVDYVIVVIMSTLAAIGTAPVPSSGLFTMLMILSVINLPVEDISLLLMIDWILNRARAVINCIGDAYCACILDHYVTKNGIKLSADSGSVELGASYPPSETGDVDV